MVQFMGSLQGKYEKIEGRLFKRSLTIVQQNRDLSHLQFAQRFYLSTICREQFHSSIIV